MKDLMPKERLTTDLLDHPAVLAWTRLDLERTEPKGIEVLRRATKSAIYRLLGIGPEGSNVIAKRCLGAGALLESAIYREVLPDLPLSALQCYGTIEDNEKYGWLFLEDAGTEPYLTALPEHRTLAAEWLAALHSLELREELAQRLPDRGPNHYLLVLRSARELLDEQRDNPFLPPYDLALLGAVIAQCDSLEGNWSQIQRLSDTTPRVLVHGDLVSKNVRVRAENAGPAFLAFDWENAGWGTPAADLAWFPDRTVNPDLEAYGARMNRRNGATAQALAECGKIFRLLDSIHWAAACLAWKPYEDWLARPMTSLQVYSNRLTEACAEWHSRF